VAAGERLRVCVNGELVLDADTCEGVAGAAVVLRWGSYLAVLLDRDKPLWPAAHAKGTSRISDEEMARINIEASAALAEWIDLHRADRGGRRYAQLVDRAVSYLPKRNSRPHPPPAGAPGPGRGRRGVAARSGGRRIPDAGRPR